MHPSKVLDGALEIAEEGAFDGETACPSLFPEMVELQAAVRAAATTVDLSAVFKADPAGRPHSPARVQCTQQRLT